MKHPIGSTPPAQVRPPRTAYSLDETAATLGVTYEQARAMVHRGEIRSIRSGRYIRIPVGALADYLGMSRSELADHLAAATAA